MYKTDKQREKEGLISYYTAPQLDQACADYFAFCDSAKEETNLPGLLVFLGVIEDDWEEWMKGGPGYSRHPRICKKALLEMRNRFEQRKDSAAIFLLKQPVYGGYTDRPGTDKSNVPPVAVFFGVPVSESKRKGKRT